MSLSDEERTIMVQREYEKALAFFRQARKNEVIGEWDVVANRLYYAVFHAVSALLINDGRKVGSHKGTVLTFGQHYVRTGIFPPEDGRFYSQLQTIREKADYSVVWSATECDLKPVLPLVDSFLQRIKDRLTHLAV